jgi:hypothetical protein
VRLFKSEEEKAAARERRAKEEYARSPVGLATQAHERDDPLLQVQVPVTMSSAAILSQIEAIGWSLEHAGYTFIVSSTSTSWDGALTGLEVGGELTGVYLFRRR